MEEFVIPLQNEDLINSDATDKYTVDRVLNVDRLTDDEITAKIEEISTRLKEEDDESQREAEPAITGIYEHQNFDPLFSLVKNASKLAAEPKTTLLHLLQDGVTAATSSISNFFKNPLFEDSELYTQALAVRRNALKMYVYLLQWLIETEEHSAAKKNSEKIPVAREKGKKGKKKQEEDVDLHGKEASIWELDAEKEKIIVMLLAVIDLDLSRLWNLPQPEESFLNLFSRIAFQVMENPANIKSKTIKRAVLILVANASVKYYQSFNLVSSILDSLYKYEHLVTPFVELFEMLINDHEFHTAVGDLLREIGKLNPRDLTRDTTGAKNVSTFISELAEKIPRAMMPFISFLLAHLEHDSYTMRNGVIQVIGFMIGVQNEGEDARADATTKTRDSLLEILIERFRDINAYTRSRVVQTWSYLCQNKLIPLKMYLTVTQLTAGRLEDKASQVRKSAIQLLTQICQYNPFSAQLRLSTFEDNLQKLAKTIKEGTGKDIESLQEAEENNEITEDEARFLKLIHYYSDAVQFIREIHRSVPIICELLGSKNASDVLEAIQFFVTATSFSVEKARDGLRKMLMLVWSKENNIREALLKAYVDLYLTPPALETRNRRLGYLFVAKNLINLTIGATLGELTSMEELLFLLMKEKHVSYGIVEVLWDIFAQKDKENNAEGRGALIVLSMLANADSNIIGNKLTMLVNVGLGPRAHVDPHLGKWACIALQKLSKRKVRDTSSPKKKGEKETAEEANKEQENKHHHERFKSNHEVFDKLRELVVNPEIPLEQWFPAAEQAINTIYMVSEKPDQLMEIIICHMAEEVNFGTGKKYEDMEVTEDQPAEKDAAYDPLTRVLFVVGQCALRQLIYIEEIHREIQRLRFEQDKTNKSQARKEAQKKHKASQKRKSVGKGKKKDGDEDSEEEDIEKELGHVGNMADAEAEAELLSIQKSLVEPSNLLGQFASIVVKVATNAEGKYSDELLRSAALLALCKYMLVSPEFCEKNLKLLFTILTHDMDPRLKANIVIVMGDLAVRFPNLLDPWTNHIYTRLRDKDARVRKNTMMVLTHLILNDMIKVKGQVSEMAICLEDSEQRIADLARLFFHELSCKGNQLYNILPETISGLSASGVLNMDSFRNIMKYLFSFIEKDRQVESLVEKLCHRFPTTVDIKQWQDIAFCLSLLNYTEKSVKKLSESFKFYKEAIASEDVYNSFMAIVAKARKFAKPELKAVVDELENKVNACFDSHKENNTVIDKAKAAKEIAKSAPKGKKQAAKKKVESDEEDSGSHDSDVDLFSVEEDDKPEGDNKEEKDGEETESKQASKARGGKKRVVEDEDKMLVDEDEKPAARATRGRAGSQRGKPAPAKAKAPPKGRGKKKQESEDEASEEEAAELSDDEASEEEVQLKARPARGSKSKKAAVESDDEDKNSASEDEDDKPAKKKSSSKSKKTESEEEKDDDDKPPKKKSSSKSKKTESEEEDEEEPPKKKADAKSGAKGKASKRVVESDEEDEKSEPENNNNSGEDVEMLDLDEVEEVKPTKKKAPAPKAAAPKGKKSKTISSEDEMEVDEEPKSRSRSGSKSAHSKAMTLEDDDEEDHNTDDEEDSKPRRGRTTRSKPAPKPAPKKAAPKRGRVAKRVVDDDSD